MAKLTKLESEMLCRSGEFVLAGEWPWDDGDSMAAIRKWEREAAALRSAIAKIERPATHVIRGLQEAIEHAKARKP